MNNRSKFGVPSGFLVSLVLIFANATALLGNASATLSASDQSQSTNTVAIKNRTSDPAARARHTSLKIPPRVSMMPHFSSAPTDSEIFEAHAFSTALIPVGTTSSAENKALADALTEYVSRTNVDDRFVILDFLDQYPNSAWRPSLLLNLGIAWRQTGYFSKAMSAWTEAWNLTKMATQTKTKALADRAFAELVQLNSILGRKEQLGSLLAQVGKRRFIGGASEMVVDARDSFRGMNKNPQQSSQCGPAAVQEMFSRIKPDSRWSAADTVASSTNGFSLAQLHQLASQSGMKYQMARRSLGAEVITNAIIHWKLGHYSVLSRERNGRYLVSDPAFSYLYGRDLWISKDALDQESDGYCLVPDGTLPSGWKLATEGEGEKVYGKGSTFGRDQNAFTPGDKKDCPDGQAHGMAQYSAHLMLVSLNMVDIPVGYAPPIGPAVNFTITYNQRDYTSEVAPNYAYLGALWTFDWYSYVSDGGSGPGIDGATVWRYVRGGGRMENNSYNSSTGFFAPDRDGSTLQYIASNDAYVLTKSDGSQEIFSQPSAAGSDSRNMLLTEIIDPQGNPLYVYYSASVPGEIDYIEDACGQKTYLRYTFPNDPYRITKVEDPFTRTAILSYDEKGRLQKITDVIGMSSAFTYDDGDFIKQLTTPYGVTTFSYTDGGSSDTAGTSARTLSITDPNGGREYIYSPDTTSYTPGWDDSSVEVTGAAAEQPELANGLWVNTQYLNYRNTLYFDKKAMSVIGNDDPVSHLDMATIYHWLHDNEASPTLTSGVLESIKPPMESRIYFLYPGQTQTTYSGGMYSLTPGSILPYNVAASPGSENIALRQPNVITRVVDDPSNPQNFLTQTYQFTYNSQGRVTSFTDPINRQTAFDYYNNGVDLESVRQTTGGIDETLAQFGGYDSSPNGAPHRPSTYTDASRQQYGLEWNAYGQLARITNPKAEVKWFGYDASTHQLLTVNQDWSGGTKTTTLGYDNKERVHTVTQSDGYSLTYDYDDLDRVTKITYPDQTVETLRYDRLNLAQVTDRSGHAVVATYDALGHPITVKDRLGRTTYYSWCGCGALEDITDPLNHVTHFDRDLEGRITAKYYDYPNNSTPAFQYGYDERSGQLIKVTDAKGQIKNYTYNLDDTLAGVVYSGTTYDDASGNPIVTPNVSFSYDPNYLRLKSGAVSSGATIFNYNPITGSQTTGAGKLESEVDSYTGVTTSYEYDELERLSSRTVDGHSESFSYDALGRLTSHLCDLGTFTPHYVDDTYRLSSLNYPNGQTTTFDYFDNIGDRLLKEIWNKPPSGASVTQFSKFDYTYDALRRIQQWTQQSFDDLPKTLTMSYDLNSQLTSVSIAGQGNSTNLAYAYDPAGNRISEQTDSSGNNSSFTVTGLTYDNNLNQLNSTIGDGSLPVQFMGKVDKSSTVTVNGHDALMTANPAGGEFFTATVNLPVGNNEPVQVVATAQDNPAEVTAKNYTLNVAGGEDRTYTYDANGNCTGYSGANGDVSYEWDADNRLHAVNTPTHRSEFTYDAFGRILKILEIETGMAPTNKVFVWDGMRMAEEFDNGQVTKRFYPEGMMSYYPSAGPYYFTFDHLGSVRELVDGSGVAKAQYDYDPYGHRTKVFSNGNIDADFGFAGYYYHAASGLYLTRYRAYDPDAGRWLNRDPIQENGGLNLYAYVANNPINFYDPYGLAIGDWWDARTYFNSGFTESWSDSANSIGQALGGALAGNWDQVADAYDSGVFGQTQNADPFTYYGTRAAVGTAAAATTAAVALEAAPAARTACKKVKDNLHFDGPKFNKDGITGRLGQLRWGSTPLIRLDYHPIPGSGGNPVLHLNIGPGEGADSIHIPIAGGSGPSVWQ